jgi:hypothetical protein
MSLQAWLILVAAAVVLVNVGLSVEATGAGTADSSLTPR